MKKIFLLLLTVVCISVPLITWAQGPGFDDDTTDAPIDGGISLLIAAGVGYGVKKVAAKRKANK